MADSKKDQEPLPLTSGCWFSLGVLTAISAWIQRWFDPFELGLSPWLPIVGGALALVLLLDATRTTSSSKPHHSGSEGNQTSVSH